MQWLERLRSQSEGRVHPAQARASEDALERYRKLVNTAHSEALERAYLEAYSSLSLHARQSAAKTLIYVVPQKDRRPSSPGISTDPETLARFSADAERRHPGMLEGLLEGSNEHRRSVLAAVLTSLIGTSVARSLLTGSGETSESSFPVAEPDISGEFGHRMGDERIVGGAGFEDDGYQFEV